MKRVLKIFAFMCLGAIVMIACLLWISQFFNLEDDTTPVIWLENLPDGASENSLEPEYQQD